MMIDLMYESIERYIEIINAVPVNAAPQWDSFVELMDKARDDILHGCEPACQYVKEWKAKAAERARDERQGQANLILKQNRSDCLDWILQNIDQLNDDQYNMVDVLKHFEVSDWVDAFETRQRQREEDFEEEQRQQASRAANDRQIMATKNENARKRRQKASDDAKLVQDLSQKVSIIERSNRELTAQISEDKYLISEYQALLQKQANEFNKLKTEAENERSKLNSRIAQAKTSREKREKEYETHERQMSRAFTRALLCEIVKETKKGNIVDAMTETLKEVLSPEDTALSKDVQDIVVARLKVVPPKKQMLGLAVLCSVQIEAIPPVRPVYSTLGV